MEFPISPATPVVLKYDGIYDLDELYKRIHQFFVEQGWEFHEEAYKGKPDETEIKLTPYKKVNEYVKFTMTVGLHFLDTKDIEVIKDGKKRKMTKTRMRIEMKFGVVEDWQGRFKGNKFYKWLGEIFQKMVFHKELDVLYIDQVYYHMYKLHGIIKEYLDSETASNAFYDTW